MKSPQSKLSRRHMLGLSAVAAVGSPYLWRGLVPPAQAQPPSFTDWGWVQPYEQVSQKSLDWLKSKGWLPLSIGYFADLPGYSSAYPVIQKLNLLGKRGLPANFTSFISGPPIVEAFIGGQTQATGYGDVPFWSTVTRGNPAVAYGLTAVNYEAAIFVRPDSPLKSIQDFKGRDKPLVIGILLGSLLEFYMAAVADYVGLQAGKDYVFAGMSPREGQYLPKGVDVVVSFDPYVSFMDSRKNARKIDVAFPYLFNKGYDFVRKEIHENAPDVVQALSDATLEATLYTRADLEKVVDWCWDDDRISAVYPRDLFGDQIRKYNTFYKPAYRYLHADFYAEQDIALVQSQFEKKRLPRALSLAEIKASYSPQYMANSLQKVGFVVPEKPVFLPSEWAGKLGKPPYPAYDNFSNMSGPQDFPVKGDLTKPWAFKGKAYAPA